MRCRIGDNTDIKAQTIMRVGGKLYGRFSYSEPLSHLALESQKKCVNSVSVLYHFINEKNFKMN